MANLDYVEATGPASVEEVAGLVAEILGADVLDGRHPWMNPDERTRVDVYTDPDSSDTTLVAVRYLGELGPRRERAQKVFDAFAKQTNWSLLLTSDDEPDDGVVAQRPASAA